MVHRSTLNTAGTLLDRFFRDAEGRTNHQLDVGFTVSDLGLDRERAEPAIDFLVSRGLLNTFGPDVAYLTDEGVRVVAEEVDLATLEVARAFGEDGGSDPAWEPETERPEVPQLVHVRLDGETSVLPLGASCTIGRSSENDVFIDDQRASKRHAVVRYERGGYVLEDLESANGTLLNGGYCVEPTRLGHDDEIVIGGTMLVYQAPASFPPPPDADRPFRRSTPPPEGTPTARPGTDTSRLADPNLKVVRGRPEPKGPVPSPAALFRDLDADRPPDDVFSDENLEPTPPLGSSSTPSEPPRGGHELFDFDRSEDLGLPESEAEATLQPPSDVASLPEVDLEDLQPTLLGEEDVFAPETTDAGEVLELSEIVPEAEEGGYQLGSQASDPGERTPAPGLELGLDAGAALREEPPGDESDESDDRTLTMTMTMDMGAEELPVATPSMAATAVSADAGRPRFLAALAELRSEVVAIGGADAPDLVKAIDRLAEHPIVRAFAEDEDPER